MTNLSENYKKLIALGIDSKGTKIDEMSAPREWPNVVQENT